MSGPAGSPRTPFVGRQRELAALEERLEAVGRGEGGVVLIAGEPGVGKTRLVLELAERARPRGCRVLFDRAYESEGMPPYLPFAEALREHARACPPDELRAQLGEGASDVALILREIRGRLPDLMAGPPLGPEHERYRLFESGSEFLLNVARAAPGGLLVVLDDLQWVDKPTLLLLQHLTRKLATAPLLLAGTYRTVEVARNPGGPTAAPDVAQRAATLLARAALGFEDALLPTGLPRRGVDDPSVRLQEEALRALPARDSALRARLMAGLARALRFAGVRERAASLSQEAIRMARQVGDPTALVYALNAQRIAGWRLAEVQERLAVATELRRLAEEVGDSELALEGRLWRFRTLLEMGEVQAAKHEVRAYSRVADELGQPQYRSLAASWTAAVALVEGRFADAERASEQALAIGHRRQSRDAAMFFIVLMLTLRRERGQLRVLADLETAARELAEEYPTVAVLRAALALLYSDLGREEEARREFERLAANDFADLDEDWVWLPSLTLIAEVCASLGDVRRAGWLYELMLPYAERNVVGASGPGVVARHLGLLAATMGRREEAQAHYDAALRLNDRMGARPAGPGPHAARLRRDAARPAWAERPAPSTAVAGTGTGDLRPTRHAAPRGAGPALLAQPHLAAVPLRAPAYPDGLTEREVEVLPLIAAGRSNREIADELVLSVRTVERHITNLYGKIDARGKADATAYALGHGLAEPRVP